MSTATAYGPSPVKRRRRTAAELADLDDAIVDAVAQDSPTTLRSVFYRVVSMGAIDKTETGYKTIGRRLLGLRRGGRVDYRAITDGTRWVTAPRTYDNVGDMLELSALTYRRSLWGRSATLVEVFTEKDAISGAIQPVTFRWDVPLGVMRGYTSESFAWQVAADLDRNRRTVMVQLGDHDPSGVGAWQNFEDKVRGFAPDCDVVFERLAVTEAQIEELNLPTRPTKKTDTRARGWVGGSVEVDAIPAPILRDLLDDYIAQFHDPGELDRIRTAEAAERESVLDIAKRWNR